MSTKHDEIVKRVKAATDNGINIKYLSDTTGVSRFRMYLWMTGKEYQQRGKALKATPFTDDEADRLNAALDNVKSAI